MCQRAFNFSFHSFPVLFSHFFSFLLSVCPQLIHLCSDKSISKFRNNDYAPTSTLSIVDISSRYAPDISRTQKLSLCKATRCLNGNAVCWPVWSQWSHYVGERCPVPLTSAVGLTICRLFFDTSALFVSISFKLNEGALLVSMSFDQSVLGTKVCQYAE